VPETEDAGGVSAPTLESGPIEGALSPADNAGTGFATLLSGSITGAATFGGGNAFSRTAGTDETTECDAFSARRNLR
jgi:hypothetical protein